MKKIHIIILIILVVAVIATVVIVTKDNSKEEIKGATTVSKTDNTKTEITKPNNTNNVQNNNVVKWGNYKVIIDGVELKLPIKYSDFRNKGFTPMAKNNSVVQTINSKSVAFSDNFTNVDRRQGGGLYTNGKTNNILLRLYNDSDTPKAFEECYVVGIEIWNDTVSYMDKLLGDVRVINLDKNAEVVIGKNNKTDILSIFGTPMSNASNFLWYYSDSNSDGINNSVDITTTANCIKINVDIETDVSIADDFAYVDFGNLQIK